MAEDKKISSGLVIGIDGANLRQGGGVTHLIELLRSAKPHEHGISQMVVWSNASTLAAIEDRPWLVKLNPSELDQGLIKRILWQKFKLSKAAVQVDCDLVFIPGGSYVGKFRPVVTMCRNMLPFEMHELIRYGWTLKRLRLLLLRQLQSHTFRHADGLIFLTKYAADSVLAITGALRSQTRIIPHGIGARFEIRPKHQRPISGYTTASPYRLIYVSIVDQYKHQWHVVEAVASLRREGLPVALDLIGPSYAPALTRLNECIAKWDSHQSWVTYHGAVPYEELHLRYKQADLGIFASSCENMPNILLEMMISGLPVVCSNRGPMPEVLGNFGIYFDPEQPQQIEHALRRLIDSPQLRAEMAGASFARSGRFTWEQCATDTCAFLARTARQHKGLTCAAS